VPDKIERIKSKTRQNGSGVKLSTSELGEEMMNIADETHSRKC